MRSNLLHRARQSASERPVGVVSLLGEFLEPEPEGHGDIEDGSGVPVGKVAVTKINQSIGKRPV